MFIWCFKRLIHTSKNTKTDLALWSKSVITDTNIIQITEVNNENVGSRLRRIFG